MKYKEAAAYLLNVCINLLYRYVQLLNSPNQGLSYSYTFYEWTFSGISSNVRSSKKIFSFYFAVLVKLHSEIQLKVLLNVRCSEFRRGRQDQCYSLRVYINLVQAHTVIYNTIKIFVVLLIQIYFNSHAAYFWIYKKDSSLYSCMVMRAVSKHC